MADVRGLVRIDAGVFDQAESRAANFGMPVGGDRADSGSAVEPDVQVAGPGNLDRGDSWQLIERRIQFRGQLSRNRARRFAKSLGQFKRDGQREFAERNVRWLLDRELRENDVVFRGQNCLNASLKGELNCAIHVRSEEHTSELQSLRHLVCRLL